MKLIFVLFCFTALFSQKTITFESTDGIEITADVYIKHKKSAPIIVLYHQAGWSRGEYKEIAPKLNALGFNCIAIDQRSGGKINGVINQTHLKAKEKGLNTKYLDAYVDMKAALLLAKENLTTDRVIIWGSSYSSALVFRLANEINVDGLLAFAPGEYFHSKRYIQDFAKDIDIPVFVTSAKNEHMKWKFIYDAVPNKKKVSYLPSTKGNHGSRALWEKFPDNEGYWVEVKSFLKQFTN